jgi:hypothetical protein
MEQAFALRVLSPFEQHGIGDLITEAAEVARHLLERPHLVVRVAAPAEQAPAAAPESASA